MVGIRFAEPLVEGRFIRRLNRFAAQVEIDGRDERVHVRNSGRLHLARGRRQCLLEVKSVTLVERGIALFPDAPTLRGCAHLEHLMAWRRGGQAAAVLFVIQRRDAQAFSPNHDADPQFSQTLRQASRAGVRILAMTCQVGPPGIRLAARVPVRWDLPGSRIAKRERD